MEEKETTFGVIRDSKVLLKTWGETPERVIGEVREDDPEASFRYFEDRFSELENKVSELEKIIEESINKGSFLMKLVHLKEVLLSHDGLGDYQSLLDRLLKQEALLTDIINKNRERNSEIKKTLIEEAKVTVDKINWKEATAEIHEIKTRWIKTGNAPEEEQSQLEEEFWSIVSGFFDKKKAFYEDKKRLGEKNKSAYEDLVKEASKLEGVHGKARFEKVKELKTKWEELGNIPKEEYGPLIDQFNKNLKPAQKFVQSTVDVKSIKNELNEYLTGAERVNLKRLEELRNTLKSYKPTSYGAKQERREIFTTIQLLKERDFLINLTRKRFKNFKEMDEIQFKESQVKVLRDLLARDKEDLVQYTDNAEKFSSSSGQMNPMIEKKLNQQKTKVSVKEQLLEMLTNS
ncbi:MAG: DUF349 domain-containing protein [Cyclobacteriaceae bacterium]